MMNLKIFIEEYLLRKLIERQEVSHDDILGYLRKAVKSIEAARSNVNTDEEVTFTFAYLGMLRAGRALMLGKGYRPVGRDQHKTVVDFVSRFYGKEFKELVDLFEKMRQKRNKFTYSPTFILSKTDSLNALKTAELFIKEAIKLIKGESPQLEFDFSFEL